MGTGKNNSNVLFFNFRIDRININVNKPKHYVVFSFFRCVSVQVNEYRYCSITVIEHYSTTVLMFNTIEYY